MRPLTISAKYLEGEAPGKKYCEVERLYCVPKSRGMGLGKSLVEEVVGKRRSWVTKRCDLIPCRLWRVL
ncbi:hypothetical protein B0O99DRAFT_619222 [Bisporella sp. PMI_857]|nr:hypothetical protein B0O99DRAFT_619222 [Bisporella sp. PMI_857]